MAERPASPPSELLAGPHRPALACRQTASFRRFKQLMQWFTGKNEWHGRSGICPPPVMSGGNLSSASPAL
jgi:hypothetical protein